MTAMFNSNPVKPPLTAVQQQIVTDLVTSGQPNSPQAEALWAYASRQSTPLSTAYEMYRLAGFRPLCGFPLTR